MTIARVPQLIIDDFGLKPLRAPADQDVHDVIAERLRQTATVVTSNLVFDEMGPDLREQPAAGLSYAGPAAPQRLLPGAGGPLLPGSAVPPAANKTPQKASANPAKQLLP